MQTPSITDQLYPEMLSEHVTPHEHDYLMAIKSASVAAPAQFLGDIRLLSRIKDYAKDFDIFESLQPSSAIVRSFLSCCNKIIKSDDEEVRDILYHGIHETANASDCEQFCKALATLYDASLRCDHGVVKEDWPAILEHFALQSAVDRLV